MLYVQGTLRIYTHVVKTTITSIDTLVILPCNGSFNDSHQNYLYTDKMYTSSRKTTAILLQNIYCMYFIVETAQLQKKSSKLPFYFLFHNTLKIFGIFKNGFSMLFSGQLRVFSCYIKIVSLKLALDIFIYTICICTAFVRF